MVTLARQESAIKEADKTGEKTKKTRKSVNY
jgi:hypothetical protein